MRTCRSWIESSLLGHWDMISQHKHEFHEFSNFFVRRWGVFRSNMLSLQSTMAAWRTWSRIQHTTMGRAAKPLMKAEGSERRACLISPAGRRLRVPSGRWQVGAGSQQEQGTMHVSGHSSSVRADQGRAARGYRPTAIASRSSAMDTQSGVNLTAGRVFAHPDRYKQRAFWATCHGDRPLRKSMMRAPPPRMRACWRSESMKRVSTGSAYPSGYCRHAIFWHRSPTAKPRTTLQLADSGRRGCKLI